MQLLQQQTLALVTITSSLQLDDFTYTEGKISRRHDEAAADFSRAVKDAYQAAEAHNGMCWCLLTNDRLPTSTVIGSHLFKWEWRHHCHVVGLADINDVGNGLPLWKPIEWAFDTSRLCIIYDKRIDRFIAHVLDPSIMNTRLADIGRVKMGRGWVSPHHSLGRLTYRDVHLQPLIFAPNSLQQPIKHVLNFQARRARKYAILHWGQDATWDFEDFFTEGLDLSDKLKHWFSSMK